MYAYANNNPINYVDPTGHWRHAYFDAGDEPTANGDAVNAAADLASKALDAANPQADQATGQIIQPASPQTSGQLTVVLAPDAVAGVGHIAVITTNQNGSGTYFTFSPKQGDSGVGTVPGELTTRSFAAGTGVNSAVEQINEARAPTGGKAYTRQLTFNVSGAQLAAAQWAIIQKFVGPEVKYNVLTNNCPTAVDTALRAAGIAPPDSWRLNSPNAYFQDLWDAVRLGRI